MGTALIFGCQFWDSLQIDTSLIFGLIPFDSGFDLIPNKATSSNCSETDGIGTQDTLTQENCYNVYWSVMKRSTIERVNGSSQINIIKIREVNLSQLVMIQTIFVDATIASQITLYLCHHASAPSNMTSPTFASTPRHRYCCLSFFYLWQTWQII